MDDEVARVPHLVEVHARAVRLHELHDGSLVVRADVAQAQVYLPHRPVTTHTQLSRLFLRFVW